MAPAAPTPRDLAWADLSVGQSAAFTVVVTEAMYDRFLALSGDDNPLHTDEAFARERGYTGRVAYGMLTASFLSTLAGVYLPGRNCLLQGVDVSFVRPVYAGAKLEVAGTITHLNEAYRQVQIAATVTEVGGELVAKAKIRAGLTGPREAG